MKDVFNIADNIRFSDKEIIKLNELSNRICENARKIDYKNKSYDILQHVSGTLEYKKYLILWDLYQYDYIRIQNDVNKHKITIDDVKDVVNIANEIHDIYNIDDILERIA